MQVRGLLLLSLMWVSTSAFASVVYQSFTWRADSRFTLSMVEGGEIVVFKGTLRQADKAQAKSGDLTVDLTAYKEGFITLAVTEDGEDIASLFLLEQQNANFALLNNSPIRERKATLAVNLTGVMSGLKDKNGWDPSLSIRAMVDYFRKNPTQELTNFLTQVEADGVKVVPKPSPAALNGRVASPRPRDLTSDGGPVELPPPRPTADPAALERKRRAAIAAAAAASRARPLPQLQPAPSPRPPPSRLPFQYHERLLNPDDAAGYDGAVPHRRTPGYGPYSGYGYANPSYPPPAYYGR